MIAARARGGFGSTIFIWLFLLNVCKTFGAEILSFARPPKTTGAARGYDVDVARWLAALAARVPHVGVPCQAVVVAGESEDGGRA